MNGAIGQTTDSALQTASRTRSSVSLWHSLQALTPPRVLHRSKAAFGSLSSFVDCAAASKVASA
jgi:hypothetical protein